MVKPKGKRTTSVSQTAPSKKRKLSHPQQSVQKRKNNTKGKERAADRDTIPIPVMDNEQDSVLSDEDLDAVEAYGEAISFLGRLDEKGIARSKKETERLRQLNKPLRKAPTNDDLPPMDSGSDDDEDETWSSGISDDESSASGRDNASPRSAASSGDEFDSDAEMPYETIPRKRRPSWDSENKTVVTRLPIKLRSGLLQKTGTQPLRYAASFEPDSSEVESAHEREAPTSRMEDVATGSRFGRKAVVDVVGMSSRSARIQAAKEQIAEICQEIMADPENSLGLLRRLHTFSLTKISTLAHPDPVPNDHLIRKIAMLSQLAVLKDIIPGYRIRSLTDKEKAEKVSQMVARTREWEQGLVVVYQTYLRSLETELKARTELGEISLRCMCTLLTEVTHFNFRVNLISCVVAQLSRKSWDQSSALCVETLTKMFRADLTGGASLEAVRLMNRMIKEKRYNVHPEVLSCLLHLRLKTELGVRASESKADKYSDQAPSQGKNAGKRAKGKATAQPHLSKKAKKALKEKKEIEREFREAEAEVDKEERANTQTETLKLLFVLYFSILKNPKPTRLLPAALRGISKYAHLVNVDFFRDLMKVLKDLIVRDAEEPDDLTDESISYSSITGRDVEHRLLCIVTAFELLSGQGEALNIDLSDFISHLYAIILPLSAMPDIEAAPSSSPSLITDGRSTASLSLVDMLFRALEAIFSPRALGTAAPPWRSAAFAKRLLTVSLSWPPASTLRALDFVAGLVAKDPKLEALLSTDDRVFDGIYRADVDDPQLCNPFGTSLWEVHLLRLHHYDARVREEAERLANFTRL